MSRFVGDAQDFQRADEPRLLVVTADLLGELGVLESGREDQEQAVEEWLTDHQPTASEPPRSALRGHGALLPAGVS